MAKIVKLGDAWPWPAASAWRDGADRDAWFESTDEHMDYGMNVLPPIFFPRECRVAPLDGFFVSDASFHDDRGRPAYAAWVRVGGRCFVREVVVDRIASALVELQAAIAAEGRPEPRGEYRSGVAS